MKKTNKLTDYDMGYEGSKWLNKKDDLKFASAA